MHDQAICLQKFGAFFGETEEANVFGNSGKIFSALAFVLNAKKVYDICFWQHLIDLVRNFDPKFLKFARNQCARTNQRDARAKLEQTKNVRARHAAKQNIADDCHVQPSNLSSLLADCVKVEQCLSGMLVCAVTRV